MALIGAILYTFTPIVALLSGFGLAAIFSSSDFQSYYTSSQDAVDGTTGAGVISGFFFFVAIITIALCVLSWIAFTKMDTPKNKGWKIFLLVLGILVCVFGIFTYGIGSIPGVFFILAFSLKGKPKNNVAVSNNEENN